MTRKLQNEIEGLLDLDELRVLARDWLGFEAPTLTTSARFAEALVRHAERTHSVGALCDAVATRISGSPERLTQIRREGYADENQLAVGGSIGAFTLEGRLGVGPSATVFHGKDGTRAVRIKVLRSAAAADREAAMRYIAQARAAGGRDHPRLAELCFAGDSDGRTVLVHSFVDGPTLAPLLAEKRARPLPELWPLLRGVLEALVWLHERRFVHGGVRASNVLYSAGATPRVTLLDAGAHFVRRGISVLSPEEHAGEPPTLKSDLYAFGSLFFELLCGRPPFEGSALDIARGRLSDQANPPSFVAPRGHVAPEVDDLLLSLLDVNPRGRPVDAASVLDLLGGLATRSQSKAANFSDDELDALVAELLEKPEDAVIAGLLDDAVGRGANPSAVAGALLVAAESLGGSPAARRLLARAAALLEPVDAAGSERAYRMLLGLGQEDEGAWAGLERLLRAHGRYDRVVELLVERLEHVTAPTERARILLRMAEVLESKLEDRDQALYAYTQSFTLDPSRASTADEIERLAGTSPGLWKDVLDAAGTAVKAESDGEPRHALLMQMSKWYAARLGRQDLAKRCLEAILLAEPAHDGALDELSRIHRNAQDYKSLAQVLVLRANSAVAPSLARDLRCEAALVLDRDLSDSRSAIALYEQVILDDPAHPEANESLCRLYLSQKAPDKALRALERWVRTADSVTRPGLLIRLAAAHEARGEHGLALESYEASLVERPDDLEALAGIGRMATKLGNGEKKRKALEHELRISTSPRQRVAVLEELARLSAEEFLDHEAAAVLYERLLEIEPSHAGALRGLAAAYEKLNRWDAPLATRALDALATSTSPEARAHGLVRAGELLEKKGDMEGAIDRYRKAIDANPEDDEAASRLRAVHLRRGDVDTVITLLEREIDGRGPEHARAGLGMELARLLVIHRKDMAKAEAVARRVVVLDPTRADAHALLGDAAKAAGRFADAAKHYGVAALQPMLQPTEAVRLLTARAEALAASGSASEAAVVADEVVERFPDDRTAWQCAAGISYDHGTPERSIALHEKLLARFGSSAPPSEVSLWQFRLGDSLLRAGRPGTAMLALETALEADSETTLPFRSLAAAYEAKGDTAGINRTLHRHLERARGDERADVLLKIGNLAAIDPANKDSAERHYLEALAIRPLDRRILLRLVELYTKGRDWARLVDTISKLSDVAPDDEQRGKRLLVAARVAWEEMKDRARALSLVKRAVELAHESDEVALEAIELQSAAGDTEGMRTLLERQIGVASRAADKGKAVGLGRRLAELHLSELHTDEAISVYEALIQLSGGNAELEDVVGELYATDPSRYVAKAEALYSRRIARDPFHPEPYRALLSFYEGASNPDAAFCVCQALVSIERATAGEERTFARQRSNGDLVRSTRLTDDDLRRLVIHPDVDALVTAVFARIQSAMLASRAKPLAALGFSPSSHVDAESPSELVRSVVRGADWLGLRLPHLVRSDKQRTAVAFVLAEERCLAFSVDALSPGGPPRESSFVAAAHLAYFIPGFAARSIVPTVIGLKAWLLAAIRWFAPRLPVAPELEGATEEASRALETHISSSARDWLAEPVGQLLDRGSPADVAKWVAGLDRTADRLGFIACGDLPTALTAIRGGRHSGTGSPVAERVRELLTYSVSPAYLELRTRLGIGVQSRKPEQDEEPTPLSESEFSELSSS